MADLDPATLAKFQKFQAMLAESPEIVEALNSPEILALAALAAETKKTQLQQPPPLPEPNYPTVGYGHSDDVSVMSEMTTPTVMTRQTVEEEEFYPEVDTKGVSYSGRGGGPRRIGMRIGVSAFEDGGPLPPPPPKKSKNRVRPSTAVRRGRIVHRQNNNPSTTKLPMTAISEHDDSTASESTEPELRKKRPPLVAKKTNWKPKAPSFTTTTTAAATVAPSTNEDGLTSKSTSNRNRSGLKGRVVHRNRSMPTNLPNNGKFSDHSAASTVSRSRSSAKSVDSGSVASFDNDDDYDDVKLSDIDDDDDVKLSDIDDDDDDEDDDVKLSDIDDDDDNKNKIKDETNFSTQKPTIVSKLTPSRSSSPPEQTQTTTPSGRSVPKMRLVPKTKSNSSITGKLSTSEHPMSDRIRSRSREKKKTLPLSRIGSKKAAAAAAPPVVSDDDENDKSQKKKPLYRARGEDSNHGNSDNSNNNISAATNNIPIPKITSVVRRWSANLKDKDDSHLPPAFRNKANRSVSSSFNDSQTSFRDGNSSRELKATTRSPGSSSEFKATTRSPGSSSEFKTVKSPVAVSRLPMTPPKAPVSESNLEEFKRSSTESDSRGELSDRFTTLALADSSSRTNGNSNKSAPGTTFSEKAKVVASDDEDEEDYVPRTIRKPATTASKTDERSSAKGSSGSMDGTASTTSATTTTTTATSFVPEPNYHQFQNFMPNEFRQGDTARPGDYLPGTDPFAASRKKKEQAKKKWGSSNPSTSGSSTRVDDWLGSGKTQKRTWRVKGTSTTNSSY